MGGEAPASSAMREKDLNNGRLRWHPAWVSTIGAPVWVTSPAGEVTYLNPRAASLLGRRADGAVGGPCHELISGRTASGRAFCSHRCPLRRLVETGRELPPFPLTISDGNGLSRDVRVMVIAAMRNGHETPYLVHCIVDGDGGDRLRRYLDGVASRTCKVPPTAVPGGALTQREKQILEQLARDRSLHEIAEDLYLSYATVRNHTQHILRKLGVHSILEAVAVFLLSEE